MKESRPRRKPIMPAAFPRPVLLPAVLALAFGCNVGAQAQDTAQIDTDGASSQEDPHKSGPGKPKTLQSVEVNGSAAPNFGGGDIARRGKLGVLGEQDMMDTPFAMTSYTSEYIEARQAYTIADVVANDPSVRTGMGYGNFAEGFVLRGFPLAGDDISFGGLYGIVPRQLVEAGTIGRLDVLRGASAFLYGVSPSGSGIGGSINIEPKWAQDAPLTRVTGDYGSDSQFGARLDASRRFGPDNRFGVRVNLGGRSGDTAIDRESRRSNYQSIAFDYRGERFRVNADLAHQRQRIDDGRSVLYVAGKSVARDAYGIPKPLSASANYAQPWTYSDLEDTYGMVRAEYDFLPELTGYIAAGADHSRERGDYSSPTVNRYGIGTMSRLGVPYQNDAQSGEAGLRGTLQTGPISHKLNLGVSALNQKKTVSYSLSRSGAANIYDPIFVPRPPSAFNGGDPAVTGRVQLHSVALSDTLGFFDDQVLLTLGARRQQMHVLGYGYASSGNKKTADYRKDATSPVAGLVVKLNPSVSLFANSIQGLAQGPSAPSSAINFGQVFAPYRSRQLEAGVKYDRGSFGSTFSLFQIKQPTGITDPDSRIFSIAGEQRNRGAEWSIYGEPLNGIKLIGGASYINAKLDKTAGGVNNGNTAVGVPKWQYNASVEWAVPRMEGLELDAAINRTGGQYLDVANTLHIAPWTRIDVGASYASFFGKRPITLRAAVLNVGNKSYWASTLGGYLTEGAARTLKLSVSVDL